MTSHSMSLCLVLLTMLVSGGAVKAPSRSMTDSSLSPIQKVVTLVTEMKAETTKEGEEDAEAYNKYKCWCETTESEKTAAIASAQQTLQELGSFVEEAAAKEGELKTEIAGLENDIAADTEALSTATKMREEENGEFEVEAADMKETLGLLAEAYTTLSKVQLMQKANPQAEHQALLQVREIVKRVNPKFKSVMQKDLYDMLGEFADQKKPQSKELETASFLGEVFLPKREAAVLAQNRGLPWEKSEDQLNKESKVNGEVGGAAGAKSYNSRSGGIVGILKQQGEEFSAKLAAAQKEEASAMAAFNQLAGAKNAEIAAATSQKEGKEVALSDLMDKAAKAKEDIEAFTKTLGADQTLLAQASKNCAVEDAEYAKRSATRNEEINALSETLNILTGDEARSLFDKTINFLQVRSVSRSSSAVAAAQEAAKTNAFQRIVKVAKSHKNWMLLSLAMHVKLDAFTKVIAAMDKMSAELQAQQKAEYEKHDTCKKDIDTNEDKIWNGKVEKRDLASTHKDQENTIAQLNVDIKNLQTEVSDAEVSLKQAGENRKAENQLFQTSIADQRAMITILNMALDRLRAFYEPKAQLMQVKSHAAPPPRPSGPAATGYSKSGQSGGVMQLLNMIIADAKRTDDEMTSSEQQSQTDYSAEVAATTASIEADREAIAQAEKQLAQGNAARSETQESQLANGAALDKLSELLTGIHGQCDFVLKYFDIRQKARADEIDGIGEAKAILSGASFA